MDTVLTHCTKMGADSLGEKNQMTQNSFVQFASQSPKVLDFNEKRLHLESVVRGRSNASVSLKINWNVICI